MGTESSPKPVEPVVNASLPHHHLCPPCLHRRVLEVWGEDIGAPDEPRIPDDIVLDAAPEPLFGSSSGPLSTEVDAAFCDTLADIDTPPRPSDDFDEFGVTQIWLDELRAVAPDSIGNPAARVG